MMHSFDFEHFRISSGLWTHYDSSIEIACSSFKQIYFKQVDSLIDFVIYKNVFCWLCNEKAEPDVQTQCPHLGDYAIRSPFSSFSGLIDYKRLDEMSIKESTVESLRCARSEFWDKYLVSLI